MLIKMMDNFITINNIKYTLADIEKDCWIRLLNGSVKNKDSMHFITLATFGTCAIGLRTVVLRKVNPSVKTIAFHTDSRSEKCKEIAINNSISALAYSNKIQIRIEGKATIHISDDTTKQAWQNTQVEARKSYLTTEAPGTVKNHPTDGLPELFSSRNLTFQESEVGKTNFALVSVQVGKIDWLHLDSQGHRRAVFYYKNGELIEMEWLVP
jgi:pyridoxamine 5'-phosphate oxidase